MEKEKLQHYSIRKLSVGAASVLIGLSFVGMGRTTQVKADMVNENQQQVVKTQKVENTSADTQASPDNTQASDSKSNLNNDQTQSNEKATNVTSTTVSRKSVRGSGQLNTSSTTNETPEDNSKATTALRTSKNEEKIVENNENKIETTTLNLNQKVDPKVLNANLVESKAQVQNQGNNDLATTTDPSKLSKDDFAEGTHWTVAGWTSASPNAKVAKSSSFTYDDPSAENLDLSSDFRTLQNGATIKATIDKNDIVKGNKILLASVNTTKGNRQQDQNIILKDANYINTTENQINFDNQVIGYISGETRNNFEADYYLNVTNTLDLASDPEIDFKLNNIVTQFNVAEITDTPIGNAGVDFDNAAKDVGSTYYLVTNSQVIPIAITASTISGYSVPDNTNRVENVYVDAVVSNYQYYGGVVYGSVSDNQNLQGVQKISAINHKLDPDSQTWVVVRTRYYTIYNNQIYWTTGAPANNPSNYNPFASSKIKTVKLANNLSSADVLAQTEPDTVTSSYQNDGSYIVAYNITPTTLSAGGKTYVENVVPHETVINNQLRDQKQNAVNQTLDYYQQRNWVPTQADILIILNTKGPKTQNDVETVTDLTPNSSVPVRTNNYIVNGATFDGELYKHAGVEYVDDVNGAVISKDLITGRKNADTNYLVTVPNGYVLASNNADGKNYRWDASKKNVIYTFAEDQKQNDSNPIVVHLTHGRKDLVDSNVIAETIHYNYADGSKAADDYVAKHVVSSRVGHKDLVTGETVWDSDWSTEIFPEVTSPHINGYTANQPKIDAQTVDGNSQDIVKTVIYNANNQKIFVHYIDDTDDQELHIEPLVGKSNTTDNYTTGDAIKNYLNLGYDLVSDDTHGQAIRYDADDEHDQNYNVHLKHHISDVTDPKLLNATFDRIVTEKLPDGKDKQITQHYVITRTGTQDQVTKKYNFSNWNTADVHEDQGDVLDGYTAEIDSANIDGIALVDDSGVPTIKAEKFTNENNNSTTPVNVEERVEIGYLPNDQKATITFIDDDAQKDKQVLQTQNLVGKSNTKSDYDTGAAIEEYLNQGYDLVSDDTQGNPITFDAHDKVDQVFTVHLKHHISDVTDPRVLTATFDRVVTETLPDGKDKQITQHYVITRTGKQDQVTKKYNFSNWNTADVHEDQGDVLDGYTAEIDSANIDGIALVDDSGVPTIKAEKFTNENNNSTTPVNVEERVEIGYLPNDQKATITFIDDDAQKDKQVLQTQNLVGKSNTKSDYDTGAAIEEYLNQGYDLVSDDTQGNPITFDAHDKVDQVFTVHLKHHISDVTDPRVLTATFDRVVTETLPDGKDKQITQHYVITRTGKQDQVTKKYTWGNWTTAQVYEDKGDTFEGYTPHLSGNNLDSFISLVDGTPIAKAETFTNENGKLLPKNVSEKVDITYTANPQEAAIVFYDDTADTSLQKNTVRGHYGEAIEFIPKVSDVITEYTKKGYVLVSNEFDNQKYAADDKQNVFVVHLKHGTMDVTRSKDVTETIHYVYDNNSKAHDDYVTTKKFENHGVKDLVTGETKWDTNWTPENDQFAQVNSPEIPGYTADKEKIPAQTVNADSKNLEYTVTYTQTPAPTPYEPSDPVQPAQPDVQPSTPVVPDQPVDQDDSNKSESTPTKKVVKVKKNKTVSDYLGNNSVSDKQDSYLPSDYGNYVAKDESTDVQSPKVVARGSLPKTTEVKSNAKELPTTGAKDEDQLSYVGLALAGLVGMFGYSIKKRKD